MIEKRCCVGLVAKIAINALTELHALNVKNVQSSIRLVPLVYPALMVLSTETRSASSALLAAKPAPNSGVVISAKMEREG